jgi:hypothetical protein
MRWSMMKVAESLPEPRGAEPDDCEDRNDKGQLTSAYNRKRRRKAGQNVSESYRATAEKASERDLGRLSFREHNRDTIEAKMWALMAMPALTKSNRIDELYGPMGRHLEGICGRDYMPETLRKTATEWSLASVGYVLQGTHAQTWHEVSQEKWERGYRDGDTIGMVKVKDSKAGGQELWARAIVIEQRTKGEWMALVTLADREEWPARRLANIYYGR